MALAFFVEGIYRELGGVSGEALGVGKLVETLSDCGVVGSGKSSSQPMLIL